VLAIVKCQTALRSGPMHHLVGTAEIADMLGVSRQRVHQLTSREDFPKPVAVLASATIWERESVEEWVRASGRRRGSDEGD
jgi:predicted DNA-binding transcriptional regulator AlpA